jgi:hypothetical protein
LVIVAIVVASFYSKDVVKAGEKQPRAHHEENKIENKTEYWVWARGGAVGLVESEIALHAGAARIRACARFTVGEVFRTITGGTDPDFPDEIANGF